MTIRTNRYAGKRKALGLSLSTTRRHPYGRGAKNLSPETLVKKGERGASSATVARELQARANVNKRNSPETYRKFSEAARIARKHAYGEHGERGKKH